MNTTDINRCVECNHLFHDTRIRIDPNDPFAFCSDQCRYDAVKGLLPPNVRRDFKIEDMKHPQLQGMIQRQLAAYRRQWYAEVAYRSEREYEKEQKERDEEEQKQREFEEQIRPRPVPEHLRFHTAIIAKTRWGKTQLLQEMILRLLYRDDPPSMVILDSTGAMIDLIQRLAIFRGPLRKRLIIVDPAFAPALNMFDISNPRFATYSNEQRDALQTEIISLFNYIFESTEYDLSGQMGLAFACAVRVTLARPNSTITDLRRLLQETLGKGQTWQDSEFINDIRRLDEDTQEFFVRQYYLDSLKETRNSIARRLYSLTTTVPAFRRMFTAPENVLDFYARTQEEGAIILVNTSEQLLQSASTLFGRFIVARLMASIFERAAVPREDRRPTELIIDEAAPYFDASFDKLLTRVAQYGLKTTVAFQHFDQLPDSLKNAVAGQTSVKFLGGLSYADARMMANETRCQTEFLQDLKTDTDYPPQWAEFAVHVDNFTNHPMKWRLPFHGMKNEPKMSDFEHAQLIEEMKRKVAPGTSAKAQWHDPRIRLSDLREKLDEQKDFQSPKERRRRF